MPPDPLDIKEKGYLTDAPQSDMPTNNVKLCCSYNIYVCWPSVTVTNTAADQTCLLVECCYKMDACWTVDTQSACMSLNIACLLVLCFSICCTCWYGVSLSDVPAGMVSHYQPCPLVQCLTIGHVFSCGASL